MEVVIVFSIYLMVLFRVGAELRSIISLKHPYEAHRKAFSIVGGRICLLDRSS